MIVPIYKKKDKLDCNNYRGSSLLGHYSKIFTSILMERIKKKTEEILSAEQAGFRPSRSTIVQIFTLRQMAEKYTDLSRDLYVCNVHFREAFDSIGREDLWGVMRNLGYPDKIVRIHESLYHGTFSIVRVRADTTNWFETIVGLLQGCILSPLLFNLFLEVIMSRSLQDVIVGAVMNGYVVNNLRFADDIAATTENQQELLLIVDNIATESARMGMKINIEKAEVQHVGLVEKEVIILIENQQLKQVAGWNHERWCINQTGCQKKDWMCMWSNAELEPSLEIQSDKQRN